jgi:hypothetical protein
MKRNKFDSFDRDFNRMLTVFWVMFTVVGLAIVAIWSLAGYVLVTKGPETVDRAEWLIDAVTDSVERSNKDK